MAEKHDASATVTTALSARVYAPKRRGHRTAVARPIGAVTPSTRADGRAPATRPPPPPATTRWAACAMRSAASARSSSFRYGGRSCSASWASSPRKASS